MNSPQGGRLLLLGLGNPGERYAHTRHNAGAWVVEAFAREAGAELTFHPGSNALIAETRSCVLVIPQTYMNESGRVLRPLRKKYGEIAVERLVVVHDELDLPVGVMRIKAGGGLAGHNGLKSVAAHIGSNDFLRIRIGIGRPPSGRESVIQWVLSRPSPSDRDLLATVTERAVRGIEAIVADGVERAMTVYNTTK